MTDIRKLIDILSEDDNLKKQVISAVKATDDENILQRVLKTLNAGQAVRRLRTSIGKYRL